MPSKGRPPKPTALHRLHGTLNVTRHRKRTDDKVPVANLSEPPSDLTPAQLASWHYVIDNAPRGLLKRMDRAALRLWCVAEARHLEASAMQQKLDAQTQLPMLVKGADGGLIISPYLKIMDRAAGQMIKLASEFGFSPVSRARLHIDPDPEDRSGSDPWDMLRLKVIDGGKDGPPPAA